MEGYNIVLETQWLRTLGLIQWDFERLQMHFELNVRRLISHDIANKMLDTTLVIKLQKRQTGVIL